MAVRGRVCQKERSISKYHVAACTACTMMRGSLHPDVFLAKVAQIARHHSQGAQ